MKLSKPALAAACMCFIALGSELDQTILSAQQAIESGNLDQASAIIAAGLKHHPDGGLYNLRGIVHARRDQMSAALRDFTEAVRLSPSLKPAWQNLARLCRLDAEHDPAADACALPSTKRVLQLIPDDAEARSGLALLYEKRGEYQESLTQLANLPPADASGTINLLVACADSAELGRTADAVRSANSLLADSGLEPGMLSVVEPALTGPKSAPVVIRLLEALDARQTLDGKPLRKLAIAYEQTEDLRDARKTLERLAILEPGNPAHLLELARLAEKEKDHPGALGYLAHARDLEPQKAQVHFLFAMVASEMELPVEARASLTRALEIEPDNPAYNFAMGTVILTTRDAASAASYFQRSLTKRPNEPKGHYALGVAEFASGDYDKAKLEMASVERDPKLAGAANYFLGRMAMLDEDLPHATSYLRKSIALMPDYAESHTELARVYLRQQNVSDARKELGLALKLDPRSFQANTQLLILYKRTHDVRAEEQALLLNQLDEERSRRAELMLRTIAWRP